MSTWPSVSSQISSAVVARWIAGLAGFLNCWGMKYFGSLAGELGGLGDRAAHALGAGREDELGAVAAQQRAALELIVSGMVRTILLPRAAQTMASAMPVLPLVGSTTTVSGPMSPASSAASIIATPMRSLTECAGLKNSSFAATSAPAPSVTLRMRTSGVLPMSSVTSLAIRMRLILPPSTGQARSGRRPMRHTVRMSDDVRMPARSAPSPPWTRRASTTAWSRTVG